MKIICSFFLALALIAPAWIVLAAEPQTMTVTAEGLADPAADTYKRDKGLMVEDLRRDAKRQILEKAVGAYVETSTLMRNYTLISDRVFSRSQGLIKRVVKESQPWVGEDGLAHMLMTAEVYVGDVKAALDEMGRQERVGLLKDLGNPRISVAITVRNAEHGTDAGPERSAVAENIFKDRIKSFGYRVWTGDQPSSSAAVASASQTGSADFSIAGEAKFKTVSFDLAASGLSVTKYVLTSWSVKCVDNSTGEEIYYNNKVPQEKSWASEDQAIEEIGRMIGSEFSKDFFDQHLQSPAKTYQLQVLGLPSYDAGLLLKKEFIGLRPVLGVEFRDFDRSGLSLYEVEFVGSKGDFNQFLNTSVLAPLNAKLGGRAFTLESSHGGTVRLNFRSDLKPEEVMARFQSLPPASLAGASPERIREVVKTEETMKKVSAMAPDAVRTTGEQGLPKPDKDLDAVKNF
jgi:serine/threonine-protein kinase